MPRKSTKKAIKPVCPQLGDGVEILNAGSVLEDPITRTLETNYMPYAMSVIVSRALPEIDGFKPAHRKLLVPFVDSKGNFGKAYSRDMSCAAARYTEAKLEDVCEELFRDIIDYLDSHMPKAE